MLGAGRPRGALRWHRVRARLGWRHRFAAWLRARFARDISPPVALRNVNPIPRPATCRGLIDLAQLAARHEYGPSRYSCGCVVQLTRPPEHKDCPRRHAIELTRSTENAVRMPTMPGPYVKDAREYDATARTYRGVAVETLLAMSPVIHETYLSTRHADRCLRSLGFRVPPEPTGMPGDGVPRSG